MALHGFNDAGWAQYKADRKHVHGGKRQIHLRKNFYRKGRASSGGGGISGGFAFLTSDVSPATLGTDHITLGEGGAKAFQRDDPGDPTSWEVVGDEFAIYSKNPVLIRAGRSVTYQEVDGVKIINDKDCG